MLATDETQSYLDFQRGIIYWLVDKLGGEIEIPYAEVRAFMEDKRNVFLVRNIFGDVGIALKVNKVDEEAGEAIKES